MNMKKAGQKANHIANQTTLNGLTNEMSPQCKRATLHSQSTGSWLLINPSQVNGLDLSINALWTRYPWTFSEVWWIRGQTLQVPCSWMQKWSPCAWQARWSKNEVAYLANLATNNGSIRNEPIINIGRDSFQSIPAAAHINTSNATPPAPGQPPNTLSNDRGDILVHSFFSKEVDCVIYVRVTDSDAPLKVMLDPMKVMLLQEKAKKKKYLARCEEQRRHFAPYVADCYGLLGKETVAINKRMASKLSAKWRTAYSVTCGFVNARISIAILRASHRCLRGSRVPFRHRSNMMAQWDDGAGLGLMR